MALTRPKFVHPEQTENGVRESKSIFDIDAYIDTSSNEASPNQIKFDLKTSLPIFYGKEKVEDYKLSMFDAAYYKKDFEDPGVYSLTHFDEPIRDIENAYASGSSTPSSLISAGRFALSSAGSSRSSIFPSEMSPEVARRYLPGLQTPSMEPENPFNIAEVRGIMQETLSALKDEVYQLSRCRNLSKNLSDYILYQLKTLEYSRYKFTCIVNIGQNLGQDLRIVSRCLWSDKVDTFVTENFQNKELFVVAMVFAIYQE